MSDLLKKYDKMGLPLQFGIESRTNYHLLQEEKTSSTIEDIKCELQLTSLGVWEPLNFNLNENIYHSNQKDLSEWWRPFQPKEGIVNDRESILIYGPEKSNPWDPCGLAQMYAKLGYKPQEHTMGYPTEAREKLTCMHEVFNFFEPLGRTFLIKLNAGGHYPPHRDHILLNRPTFRLIAFLGSESIDTLRWEVEDRQVRFIPNTVYYVDTRKTHRLWSAYNGSTMVVINVIKNWNNILKVLSRLKYQ